MAAAQYIVIATSTPIWYKWSSRSSYSTKGQWSPGVQTWRSLKTQSSLSGSRCWVGLQLKILMMRFWAEVCKSATTSSMPITEGWPNSSCTPLCADRWARCMASKIEKAMQKWTIKRKASDLAGKSEVATQKACRNWSFFVKALSKFNYYIDTPISSLNQISY